MKKLLLATAALVALPVMAQAQMAPNPGFYIGAEGGLNWMFNSTVNPPGPVNNINLSPQLGWAAGGKVGYDFVGPRVELEGLYHSNNGSGLVAFPGGIGRVNGKIDQVSVMANVFYDFMPGNTITPFIGAGAGIAFVDSTIQGCNMCSTQFAYQGI